MVFYLVAQVLHEAGLLLGVGLEMFRSDSRAGLDRWVVGALAEKDGVLPGSEFIGNVQKLRQSSLSDGLRVGEDR